MEDDTVEKEMKLALDKVGVHTIFKVSGYSFFQFIIGGGAHSNTREEKIKPIMELIRGWTIFFCSESNTLGQQEVGSNTQAFVVW